MNIENENENTTDIDNGKSAEQLASEHNLDLSIEDELKAQSEQGGQVVQQQVGENAQQALSGLLTVVPMGLTVVGLKNTAAVWSGDVINGVSSALIPVLRKYTFGQKFLGYLQSGGGVEEFALMVALAPVAIATYSAYQLDTKSPEKVVEGEEVRQSGKQSADTPLGSTFVFKDE